ncbi:hypothetical protein [Thermoflexus hugenholtzii]|uniref:Uncharacterized protein n=1 Tax=Thermoflexus hugenholtzii JAD2 TaxID=877466 RepID=A0A212RN14_9CHLR|nr:hypothetical protein [Thermoflexus hugenholtzii]SNB73875.1 hypothetical protein SAMN02746019_00019920 [Thermoflexus hugenholtzii JAD2]
MVGWRKLSRKRRSEIRWEIAGFLYLLIILPFLAWLANSARLRNFTRFPSWVEIFPAFLISLLFLVARLSGERRGWIPWLSRTMFVSAVGLWILSFPVVYWPLLLPKGWGWLPAVTYSLALAIGLVYGWRRGWETLTDRLDRVLEVMVLFSGGSSAAPLGAHLGMQASRSGGYGLVDILLILATTAVGYWIFFAGIAQNWHLRPLGLRPGWLSGTGSTET